MLLKAPLLLCPAAAAATASAAAPRPLSAARRPMPSRPEEAVRRRRGRGAHSGADPGRPSTSVGRDPVLDWPICPRPTPYQILDLAPGAPYCKARFYRLVKLYHPDLCASASSASFISSSSSSSSPSPSSASPASTPLSASVRLERYRLVVRAHSLLSDPHRRRLYDATGAGWADHHADPDKAPREEEARRRYRAWRGGPLAGTAGNATWEDWERWYEDRAAAQAAAAQPGGGPGRGAGGGEPTYMSHRAFASLLLAAVAFAAILQRVRIDAHNATMLSRQSRCQAETAERLRRSGAATAGLSRQEKIDRFVRERENQAYDFRPAVYDRLPEQGVEKKK